jgi:hypothetical protein
MTDTANNAADTGRMKKLRFDAKFSERTQA